MQHILAGKFSQNILCSFKFYGIKLILLKQFCTYLIQSIFFFRINDNFYLNLTYPKMSVTVINLHNINFFNNQ